MKLINPFKKTPTIQPLAATSEELRNYIIVFHTWFVDSKGFKVVRFEAENDEAVEAEALRIKARIEGTFKNVAFAIIEQ